MTAEHNFAISRRVSPEVCILFALLENRRAQGGPGARCTRGPVCNSLHGLNWVLLAGICEVLLGWLAPVIHLGTLMMVPVGTSATGLVFTFLLPGIAQAYWLWELWPATSTLSHPLALVCAAWLALLGVRILAQIIRVGWRAPHSLTHHRVQMKPLPKLRRS